MGWRKKGSGMDIEYVPAEANHHGANQYEANNKEDEYVDFTAKLVLGCGEEVEETGEKGVGLHALPRHTDSLP